ncbi:MAG: hypothetical protein LBN27_10975 [Prevotellaceae bacterium]|jgi:hypothetical protein|nr:hypothetical protein [Prevotellaceae bacterium]
MIPFSVIAGFDFAQPPEACHCGLDPQSPEKKGILSFLIFIRTRMTGLKRELRVKPAMTENSTAGGRGED